MTMKVKRSRTRDVDGQEGSVKNISTIKPSQSHTMKKSESEKSKRRKSNPFHGLSKRTLFHSEGSKSPGGLHADKQEEKTSLLKRLGSRRSSKKKCHKTSSSSETDIDRSTIDTDRSTICSVQDSNVTDIHAKADDAGHTPKMKRIQKMSSSKVYEMIQGSPWDSDESDNEHSKKHKVPRVASIKRKQSLKEAGRKLTRSMSMLCGVSRSKHVMKNKSNNQPDVICRKGRRSLGLIDIIIQKDRKQSEESLVSSSEAEEKENETSSSQNILKYNTRNAGGTPKTADLCQNSSTPTSQNVALRRQSFGGVNSLCKKSKPKRHSYERMNLERDAHTPKATKQHIINHTKGQIESTPTERSPPKRRQSLKRTISTKKSEFNTSIQKSLNGNTAENPAVSRKESFHRSTRRKSLGAQMTPSNDRRSSGIYASTNTPTFMTCGFVMTDSPPDSGESNRRNTIKRKRTGDENGSKVNRFKAGHTPVPPRKKRCSHGERLIM